MNLLFLGMTCAVIGKILLAAGVIMAHTQLAHEHKIDELVIRSFHTEKMLTLIGVGLIIAGYVMEVYFFGGFHYLLTCTGLDCGASLGNLLTQ